MKESKWEKYPEIEPTKEGYYKVMFENGIEDEKPFRIRLDKGIKGFMTENKVVAWKSLGQ